MTGWYDFSNVKSSKMLSFYSVAEAHGLIYPSPSAKISVLLARSPMKHSFHVFDHVLKTFQRVKRLGFASTLITLSCFHIMIKQWNSCFIYYRVSDLERVESLRIHNVDGNANVTIHFSVFFPKN